MTLSKRLKLYKNKPGSLILLILVMLATLITVSALVFIIGYILINGIPHLTPEFFSWDYNSENLSCVPALLNTILLTVIGIVIAVPLGIFSAIYLVEYAKKGNKLVKVIRMTAETLSGVPSIVYGLFGMLCFNVTLGWGYSIVAGAFTVAIMILPLIMRTTEEALLTVPDSFREGSFGLGAGKLRTVFRIVLPSAVPGILSGVILAVGRIVGETAALLYTSGSSAELAKGITDPGRTLALHMYVLSNEGLHTDQAYATAVVLLIMVLVINTISAVIAKKVAKAA
ncbi:MAG: phosphate ABC transporter permease PstA [Acutalibacteraceae bacterium]